MGCFCQTLLMLKSGLFEALTLDLESDLVVDRMLHYEVIYVIHEERKDEVESVNMKVQDVIKEKKRQNLEIQPLGHENTGVQYAKSKECVLYLNELGVGSQMDK